MIDTKLHKLIKSLDEWETGTALLNLMDWCNVTNMLSVSPEEAEIFYILYNNIVHNPVNLTDIKIIKKVRK